MDAPNKEFRAFFIHLYSGYWSGGLQSNSLCLCFSANWTISITNSTTLVDGSNKMIYKSSHWLHPFNSKFASLQGKYQALVANKQPTTPSTMPTPTTTQKLNKLPTKKPESPELIEFESRTWKWCNKCFGGCWNRTHITEEHQPGKGRSKNKKAPGNILPATHLHLHHQLLLTIPQQMRQTPHLLPALKWILSKAEENCYACLH